MPVPGCSSIERICVSSQGRESKWMRVTVVFVAQGTGGEFPGEGEGGEEGASHCPTGRREEARKGGGGSGLQRRMDGCRDFLTSSRLSRLSDWCLFFFPVISRRRTALQKKKAASPLQQWQQEQQQRGETNRRVSFAPSAASFVTDYAIEIRRLVLF